MTLTNWIFNDPKNVAVIANKSIFNANDWIAYVYRDPDDGLWQFHTSEPVTIDEVLVVALHEVVDVDSSIAFLADLPPGWKAWRVSIKSPWQRMPYREI